MILPSLFVLLACDEDVPVTYSAYNAEDESVEVQVGASEVLDAVSVDLHSNTGEVLLGSGSVDPGGGPLGTVHRVKVSVDDTYSEDVDRVSVRIDSGERGEDEYDLTADSTGKGIWVYELTSVGEEGETRTDTFTFLLWAEDETDTGGEDTGTTTE